MDCSPSGSSDHGILQARIPEWVAISFSRGSFRPRDRTHISYGRQVFTTSATWVSICLPVPITINIALICQHSEIWWNKSSKLAFLQKDHLHNLRPPLSDLKARMKIQATYSLYMYTHTHTHIHTHTYQ